MKLFDGTRLDYGHLVNCSGLYADVVARKFDVGKKYRLFPFKGIYWSIKRDSLIKIQRNIYTVIF